MFNDIYEQSVAWGGVLFTTLHWYTYPDGQPTNSTSSPTHTPFPRPHSLNPPRVTTYYELCTIMQFSKIPVCPNSLKWMIIPYWDITVYVLTWQW